MGDAETTESLFTLAGVLTWTDSGPAYPTVLAGVLIGVMDECGALSMLRL